MRKTIIGTLLILTLVTVFLAVYYYNKDVPVYSTESLATLAVSDVGDTIDTPEEAVSFAFTRSDYKEFMLWSDTEFPELIWDIYVDQNYNNTEGLWRVNTITKYQISPLECSITFNTDKTEATMDPRCGWKR